MIRIDVKLLFFEALGLAALPGPNSGSRKTKQSTGDESAMVALCAAVVNRLR
jgi:hypothetical protein